MSLAHYLLQVNIYLVIFYCFYKLLLASETYFVLNRIYLLASGLLSLAIPFLRFEWFGKQEVAKPIYVGFDQLNNLVTQVSIVEDANTSFNWGNFIVIVYLLGILVAIARLTFQLLAVRKLLGRINNGEAFSFFRKKIVSLNIPEPATVNLHEDIHVKQLHTVDVLFFELIGIIAWFNPIIYAYKKTIKNIHEYLADEAAAKFQGDKEAYSLLLLSQAFGVSTSTLTNRFFTKSLIKRRIMMLHKQRSKKIAILKYGLFVPIFALTLVLSSATIRKNNKILEMAGKIPLDNVKLVVDQAIEAPLSVVNLAPAPPTEPEYKPTLQYVTLTPAVKADNNDVETTNTLSNFYTYLAHNIKYPAAAIEKKVQGNAVINFTVRDGKITDANVQHELGEGCDEEVMSEILAYDQYLRVDGDFSIKVTFKLDGIEGSIRNEGVSTTSNHTALQNIVIVAMPMAKEPEAEKVYNFVALEQPPTYPGGIEQFYKFLGSNIKYPAAAIDNELQGNVHISFTVEKDGSLTDIKVERKLGLGTDEEAVRVVKLAKKWNPGTQNGRPVRVRYNIPVKFSLDPAAQERQAAAIANLRLRSYNSTEEPLVIVDNEIRSYLYLKTLDSKSIESINVLTSTSALPIYGKAAENGAIIVKSKTVKPRLITGTFNNKN